MRLRIDNPAAAPQLVAFLLERVDTIAHQVTATEIQVSLLGSLAAPHNEVELERRLERWRAAHPGHEVGIIADA